MTTNERIARGLGYQYWLAEDDDVGHWCPPKSLRRGECTGTLPDYEHSLDALLPVLAAHPEWFWSVRRRGSGRYDATIESLALDRAWVSPHFDTPSEALALAVADALEASE